MFKLKKERQKYDYKNSFVAISNLQGAYSKRELKQERVRREIRRLKAQQLPVYKDKKYIFLRKILNKRFFKIHARKLLKERVLKYRKRFVSKRVENLFINILFLFKKLKVKKLRYINKIQQILNSDSKTGIKLKKLIKQKERVITVLRKLKLFINNSLKQFFEKKYKKKYNDYHTTLFETGALRLYNDFKKAISRRFYKKFYKNTRYKNPKRRRKYLKKNYYLGKLFLNGSKNNFYFTYMESGVPKKYITVRSNYETRS